MAYYASMAIPHDMIGIATTNALPVMAPWGGAERLLGINPISIAIPTDEEFPLIYDAAFSGSSVGKIRVYQQKGLQLPAGWALDRQGSPTTDPAVAIDGLLAPIGGFKGAGLAMIMGIFASMLSGAAYGTELGSLETGAIAGQDGHFVAALSIAAFEDVARFKTRVDGAIRQIHNSRLATGFDRVYAPGELEQLSRQKSARQGIRLNQITFEDLTAAARRAGVSETDIAALLISS
jgi:LDH2 family malate/lactate/ureidoglycolate dehydrogenase